METTQEKATLALSYFTTGERISTDTGRAIVTTTDDKPEWITELCHEAHGDFMPDDWRYEMIHDALLELEESEPDVYNIEPPIYNAERLAWLGSHLERAGYCDEAMRELSHADRCDILDCIGAGYLCEFREVYGTVETFLEALNL